MLLGYWVIGQGRAEQRKVRVDHQSWDSVGGFVRRRSQEE